jgi:hypothetical protein
VEGEAAVLLATLPLKEKRVGYTTEQKQAILAVYHTVNQTQSAALRAVRKKGARIFVRP